MSKQGNDDKLLKEAIALGRRNKDLLPKVKNWCRNIKIEDISGGLVAQMHQLPTNLRISCPHAAGAAEAMNFEWNAHSFIINNCRACEFHSEIHTPNFGRDIIKEYLTNEARLKEAEKEEAHKKQALKEHIDGLIAKAKSNAEITELSILTLIQSIETDKDPQNIAKQILEASKLSPDFFGDTALDYLSLFFDVKEIWVEILLTTESVLAAAKRLPTFSFTRLTGIVENGTYIDEMGGVLRLAIKSDDIGKYESLLNKILDNLRYMRHVGDPYDSRPIYPKSISLLLELYEQAPDLLFKLLDERLKLNDKTSRININYLLQELLLANSTIVMLHCATIIKSLELEDDNYEDSADTVTCITLGQLFKLNPDTVLSHIDIIYPALTEGAKVEFIRFYELILLKEDFVSESSQYGDGIVEKLLQIIFSSTSAKDLREKVLSILKHISKKHPTLLSNSFDSLVGYLVDQVKAYNTFNWYLNELKDPGGKISTFNPLQGKNYLEVESERMGFERTFSTIESTIEHLVLNDNSEGNYNKILAIIANLKSSSDGLLKGKLIAVIRRSVTKPLQLAELLPSIYNFLLDSDSKYVRYEAINFATHLVDKYDKLVTHTLIDIIKVFMSDIDRGIKGKAIEAFGSVIKKFPNEVEEEQIQIVLKSVIDSYVVIHKSAAKLAYKISPFLNESQKLVLITAIATLEEIYYKEKDYSYCEDLVDILLFFAKENPKMYSLIVHNFVVKYCDSKEYYTDVDFIKKLTFIRSQNGEFNKIWLEQSLGFIVRTSPDYHNPSFDIRNDLFITIYKLPKQIIVEQLETIKNLIIQKIQEAHFRDVFNLFGILGYFRLYEPLQQLSNYMNTAVSPNRSNEYAVEANNISARRANLELKVWNRQIDKAFVNSLNIQ